jgi:SAM-dependent methyltransferase
MVVVSEFDKRALQTIRGSVEGFLAHWAFKLDRTSLSVLEIGPPEKGGVKDHFVKANVKTTNLFGSDYDTDITDTEGTLEKIKARFDLIVCAEVIEHVTNPFSAIKTIENLLLPNGTVLITTPFNFRIHGPLPDCWRITEHGLKVLLSNFENVVISEVATNGRDLMPIHYVASGNKKQ